MNIEITRGRSDIYDILTHLTFLFIESGKICYRVLIEETGETIRDWNKLEQALQQEKLSQKELEVAQIHTANILGRSFDEILAIYDKLSTKAQPHRFLSIIYWLGKLAIEEEKGGEKRVITFSVLLRERLGHHIHGDRWATTIKELLQSKGLLHRPLHIISANMHSVVNSLFAKTALKKEFPTETSLKIYKALSQAKNQILRDKVLKLAAANGMLTIDDRSGTSIDVQIFDLASLGKDACCYEMSADLKEEEIPVILVMDYAFGEQAFETIDELLKPYQPKGKDPVFMNVASISIMGKAGILAGGKGDLMIPTAHIFEGTADNYPIENAFSKKDFEDNGLHVFEGPMVTVLGTSLQNKDILLFFKESTWGAIGLEMEGVHYQKAIQAASKIRQSIRRDVVTRYAYYASDNPLETGSTLASGGLGTTGVKPTYLITDKILQQIFNFKS